jgi:hypothetical protein
MDNYREAASASAMDFWTARVLAKLVRFNEDQRVALEQVRTVVWELLGRHRTMAH